jgi:hypothetical protein
MQSATSSCLRLHALCRLAAAASYAAVQQPSGCSTHPRIRAAPRSKSSRQPAPHTTSHPGRALAARRFEISAGATKRRLHVSSVLVGTAFKPACCASRASLVRPPAARDIAGCANTERGSRHGTRSQHISHASRRSRSPNTQHPPHGAARPGHHSLAYSCSREVAHPSFRFP